MLDEIAKETGCCLCVVLISWVTHPCTVSDEFLCVRGNGNKFSGVHTCRYMIYMWYLVVLLEEEEQ